MKAQILCIGTCLLMILPMLAFSGGVKAQPGSTIEQATFCNPGTTRPCPDVGICTGRVKTCDNGRWSDQCTGGVQPLPKEICGNGLDDDCDGIVDNGCVSLADSAGLLLIGGGTVLLILSLALMRFIK
jgi:hypothetical protein